MAAREQMGYKFRPAFAREAKVSVRSLAAVENGEPGVGAANLRAIGRALQGWTEDTPRIILEGGPIPSPAADDELSPRDDFERKVIDSVLPIGEKIEWVKAHRAALEEERRLLRPQDERHPNSAIVSNGSDTNRQ